MWKEGGKSTPAFLTHFGPEETPSTSTHVPLESCHLVTPKCKACWEIQSSPKPRRRKRENGLGSQPHSTLRVLPQREHIQFLHEGDKVPFTVTDPSAKSRVSKWQTCPHHPICMCHLMIFLNQKDRFSATPCFQPQDTVIKQEQNNCNKIPIQKSKEWKTCNGLLSTAMMKSYRHLWGILWLG